ncbi:MAG TPA: type II secretion system F family protein [Casimicrobiaceae bacterium]
MALIAVFAMIALVAAIGTAILVRGLQPSAPTNADLVDMRLNVYEGTLPLSLDEMELQEPLSERLVLPLIRRVARALAASTPEQQIEETQRKLVLAGKPFGLSAVGFLALRYIAAMAFAGLGLGIGVLTGNGIMTAVLLAGGAILGIIGPGVLISRRIGSRRSELLTSLPDALDLLIVSVEAGLTFEAALARVAEKFDNALGEEFSRVLQETRLGRPYLRALEDLGNRVEVEELQNFIQAVVQSQQLGVGIARILQLQAGEIRRKRMQRAEERGAQASIKMLIPMIGCIFPTIWIVLLGPALLIVIHVIGHK